MDGMIPPYMFTISEFITEDEGNITFIGGENQSCIVESIRMFKPNHPTV